MHRSLALVFLSLICINLTATAEPPVVPQHHLAGGQYVSVRQLASIYELGRDHSSDSRSAKYQNGTAALSIEADHRDIHLNGVVHWLSEPVILERGSLWIRADDVTKTITPVLHPLATSAPIRMIVLDPGHGGADTGARGLSGHVEKEWTLDVARHVASDLTESGIHVVLTRETDATTPLESRPAFCLGHGGDVFVSIHFNSGGPSAMGIETYCLTPAGNSSTDDATAHRHNTETQPGNRWDEHSVWLAHCVHTAALSSTGAADRGVRRARFEVLRDANCPAILIEGGFLTNATEEPQILKPEYRERLAAAIAKGILAYVHGVEPTKTRRD